MANKVKGISDKMSKKFLEKERQVGRMMATITTLFFLVFLAMPLVRQVKLMIPFIKQKRRHKFWARSF